MKTTYVIKVKSLDFFVSTWMSQEDTNLVTKIENARHATSEQEAHDYKNSLSIKDQLEVYKAYTETTLGELSTLEESAPTE